MSKRTVEEAACWTPEEAIDVAHRRRRRRRPPHDTNGEDTASMAGTVSLRERFDTLGANGGQAHTGDYCARPVLYQPLFLDTSSPPPRPPRPPLHPRLPGTTRPDVRAGAPGAEERREQGHRQRSRQQQTPARLNGWKGKEKDEEGEEKEASGQNRVLERLLAHARREGREFDTLRMLAFTCKSAALKYSLGPNASVALVKRYVDAFMREKVHRRKFEMENTPTKAALEPYYVFARERDPAAHEARFPTCTLTAPAIRACWKGIAGVPPVLVSYAADSPWHERRNGSGEWDRIKTKTWSTRNPLVRLVSMYAQAHSACAHAPAVHDWVSRVKKWPLAKQRKPWEALTAWHEAPPYMQR